MNQQNPACRDAFIAAMKADGLTDRMEWEVIEGGTSWDWIDEGTAECFFGFAMSWKPPRDVDTESVLGKLKQLCVTPDTVFGNVLGGEIKIADLIDVIESQEQRVKELEAEARGYQLLADGIPAIPGTSAWHPERAYRGTVQEGTSVAFRPTIGPNKYHSIGDCYSTEDAMQAAKERP